MSVSYFTSFKFLSLSLGILFNSQKNKRMGACIETAADKELEIKTLENNTLHSYKKNVSCKKYKNNGDGVS